MNGVSTWPAALNGTRGLVVAGVSWWNRKAVAGLLRSLDPSPRIVPGIAEGIDIARRDGRVLIAWASKLDIDLERRASDAGVSIVRIEDGFLRSVGLGAGLVRGASYVLDGRGIYYDATRPSDIEHLLQHAEVSSEEVQRGANLVRLITARNLSKYNLTGALPELPEAGGRERVLVPGQVAADAAIRQTISATVDLGATNVNLELLRAVRRRHPRALIVYKPHPDVARDLRPGAVPYEAATKYADAVVAEADILSLIGWCDRVETLSSLSGFEALVRGKTVAVHGAPFYAGWGLTEDLTRVPRRTRVRSVAEIAYLALVRYCRYVDPATLAAISCEKLIERLAARKAQPHHRLAAESLTFVSWVGRKLGL